MAAPNMLQLNSIYGNSASVPLTTTSEIALLSNAAASNMVLKVNALYVANTSGSTVTITINLHNAAAIGGTASAIASTVSVPANSTLTVIDKDANLYLIENTSIGAVAGTGSSALICTISWEQCS